MFPLKETVGTTVAVPSTVDVVVSVKVTVPVGPELLAPPPVSEVRPPKRSRELVGKARGNERRTRSQRNGWSQRCDRDGNRRGRSCAKGSVSGVRCADQVHASAQGRALRKDVIVETGGAGYDSGNQVTLAIGIESGRCDGVAIVGDGHRAGGNTLLRVARYSYLNPGQLAVSKRSAAAGEGKSSFA